MPGLAKLLRGCLEFNAVRRPKLLQKFQAVKEHPAPKAVTFSCMDNRIILTTLLQADIGDMYLVRNAGNLVPHSETLSYDAVSTEPGALELGCVLNNIPDILVCGHSDCKAMGALYGMRDQIEVKDGTPLTLWLKKHGHRTITKYNQLLASPKSPLEFKIPGKTLRAFIDPENKFSEVDKLSQVNVLQQVENACSYDMLKEKLEMGELRVTALWFNLTTADFFMFSQEKERFLQVNESNIEHLAQNI